MFSKRVTKLIEKAAQAVAEGGQKLKHKIRASSQGPSQGKNSKNKPSVSEDVPSTSEESITKKPSSHAMS
jgi:hypothetical protein